MGRNEEVDESDKIWDVVCHLIVYILEAECLDMILIEGLKLDLERLVVEKGLPLAEINILRHSAQVIMNDGGNGFPADCATITVELAEAFAFCKLPRLLGE